jgi:transcriptional regulator with XRE-family HTH domain
MRSPCSEEGGSVKTDRKVKMEEHGYRIARNVTLLRRVQGMSLAEMSRRIIRAGGNLNELSVGKIERFERRIDVDDLFALAKALDVSVQLLIERELDLKEIT